MSNRKDSTGRSRELGLSWLEVDKVVNIKVRNTVRDGSDLVVRVAPEMLAEDLNALQIPGLTVTYQPPVEVPKGIGAVVINGDRHYVRTSKRVWRNDHGSPFEDLYIYGLLNATDGTRAAIASEGVTV